MKIGGEIVNQAFTLLLGSIAVAFALAVWLGSKEVAWEEVKKLIEKMKK
jgi:Na+/H+-translocating membrane pyrophosphatase